MSYVAPLTVELFARKDRIKASSSQSSQPPSFALAPSRRDSLSRTSLSRDSFTRKAVHKTAPSLELARPIESQWTAVSTSEFTLWSASQVEERTPEDEELTSTALSSHPLQIGIAPPETVSLALDTLAPPNGVSSFISRFRGPNKSQWTAVSTSNNECEAREHIAEEERTSTDLGCSSNPTFPLIFIEEEERIPKSHRSYALQQVVHQLRAECELRVDAEVFVSSISSFEKSSFEISISPDEKVGMDAARMAVQKALQAPQKSTPIPTGPRWRPGNLRGGDKVYYGGHVAARDAVAKALAGIGTKGVESTERVLNSNVGTSMKPVVRAW